MAFIWYGLSHKIGAMEKQRVPGNQKYQVGEGIN